MLSTSHGPCPVPHGPCQFQMRHRAGINTVVSTKKGNERTRFVSYRTRVVSEPNNAASSYARSTSCLLVISLAPTRPHHSTALAQKTPLLVSAIFSITRPVPTSPLPYLLSRARPRLPARSPPFGRIPLLKPHRSAEPPSPSPYRPTSHLPSIGTTLSSSFLLLFGLAELSPPFTRPVPHSVHTEYPIFFVPLGRTRTFSSLVNLNLTRSVSLHTRPVSYQSTRSASHPTRPVLVSLKPDFKEHGPCHYPS